jgi:hypothetical protein
MANLPGTLSGLTRRQQYEQTAAQLISERASFDAHWRELSEYYSPVRSRFTTSDRNRGDRRSGSIIDSEPLFAAETLKSGLHAGITSPARPWFRLTTGDLALAERANVKQWLHVVTQRLHEVFLRSNLYNGLPVLYHDTGIFATGAMSMLEDDEDVTRVYNYPIGSYAIGLDARNVATTFVYQYRRTVRQLIAEFGRPDTPRGPIDWRRFSTVVKSYYDQGQLETAIEVIWFVTPNDEYDPSRLEATYAMRWKSCHFEKDRRDAEFEGGRTGFLRESGFRRFPIFVPRWSTTGEDTYGTSSPGIIALGDVKQLQFMQKKKAKAIDKAIDPPLVGPPNLKNQKVSLNPGDITYSETLDRNTGLRPIHDTRLEGIRELTADMAETRDRIARAFFVDLFLMVSRMSQTQPITAEEVRVRQEEKLSTLGPVTERFNDDLLDPMIDRGFDILLAAGAIPEPPEELLGVELKVEYLSIMAQAQKANGVQGLDRFLTTIVGMAEHFPEALDKVDALQVVDVYGDKLGIDPNIVRSDEDAMARVQARQQAQAAAEQAEQVKALSQSAQALGQTPMQGGRTTALDAVMAGAA